MYDASGAFVGVRRMTSGKPLVVDGVPVEIVGIVGATGLELKSDPGVPFVYAGFAGMMVQVIFCGPTCHVPFQSRCAKLCPSL